MFNICPCNLCEQPMSFVQLREGVFWSPKNDFASFWTRFWNSGELAADDVRFAHKNCWKNLSEKRRKLIRVSSDKHFKPRTMGAIA